MSSETRQGPAHLPAIGVGTLLGAGIGASRFVEYARAADDAGLDDVSVGELCSTEVFALAAAMGAASTVVLALGSLRDAGRQVAAR